MKTPRCRIFIIAFLLLAARLTAARIDFAIGYVLQPRYSFSNGGPFYQPMPFSYPLSNFDEYRIKSPRGGAVGALLDLRIAVTPPYNAYFFSIHIRPQLTYGFFRVYTPTWSTNPPPLSDIEWKPYDRHAGIWQVSVPVLASFTYWLPWHEGYLSMITVHAGCSFNDATAVASGVSLLRSVTVVAKDPVYGDIHTYAYKYVFQPYLKVHSGIDYSLITADGKEWEFGADYSIGAGKQFAFQLTAARRFGGMQYDAPDEK